MSLKMKVLVAVFLVSSQCLSLFMEQLDLIANTFVNRDCDS